MNHKILKKKIFFIRGGFNKMFKYKNISYKIIELKFYS